MISIVPATGKTMTAIPAPTCVSNFEILTETSEVLLNYISIVILAIFIFNTMIKESYFEKVQNNNMIVFLLKHLASDFDIFVDRDSTLSYDAKKQQHCENIKLAMMHNTIKPIMKSCRSCCWL